jgi:hypothetical protein
MKEKRPTGIPRSGWEQQVRTDGTQKEEHEKQLRRSCGKRERLGCQDDPSDVKSLRRRKNKII